MDSLTASMKSLLWQRFGTVAHPAEWDGLVYGGGKISQRFWEYFKTVEYLDLRPGATIIDIGGGSPATGLSFFPRLLAAFDVRVIVIDTNFGTAADIPANVQLVRGLADRRTLEHAIAGFKPTHISCVSVFEHASDAQQRGIFEAVESSFQGSTLACTFEFHETKKLMDNQLTTATLSAAVSCLKRYYLSDMEASPVHCEDTITDTGRLWRPLALRFLKG